MIRLRKRSGAQGTPHADATSAVASLGLRHKNTRRCKRSIEYQANIFDTRHYSKNYCGRLEKYAKRDFAVAVPGLEEASLSQRLLASTYLLIQRHDILLRVDDSGACSPASATVAVGGSGMKVQYSRAVRATVVNNLARIVVIDRGQFERLSVPSEQPCEACQKPCFADTAYTKAVVPMVGELPGEYFVLYGCQHAKGVPSSQASSGDDDEEQEGDEGYSQAFVCALCITRSEGASRWGTSREKGTDVGTLCASRLLLQTRTAPTYEVGCLDRRRGNAKHSKRDVVDRRGPRWPPSRV